MKKLSLVILTALICNVALAQKYVPKFSNGTVINFNVDATAVGQQVPLMLTVTSITDPLTIQWSVPGLGTGSYQLTAAGLASGTKMKLKEPEDGMTKLKDDETIMVISKASLASLLKDQFFLMNNAKFTAKADADPFKINDKEADVIHAVSANGKVEVWILNNPDFPLICKLLGSPQGLDLNLLSIKE